MLKNEWKKLLSNKLMLVVVVAIVAIHTIYTTLFLGSMWDPYGSVEHLPVALVNQDQPVEMWAPNWWTACWRTPPWTSTR